MTNIKKLCLVCNKEFITFPNVQNKKRKYCSWKCYVTTIANRKITWGDKISKAKMGHGWPSGYHENQSIAQKKRFETNSIWNKGIIYGRARWFWKDNPNEYRNLHKRIGRKFGKPNECEYCKQKDLKRYYWANKTGKYLEVREDWLRLCAKCHMKYDKVNIL